jgi:mono/diheme cytochrome c family protein
MTRIHWIFAIFLGIFPLAARAQQADAGALLPLNDTQKLGQRIYQQRCGVCHTIVAPVFPMYGPALYKDLVIGSEDAIKEMIRSGTSKMPGFKLGLQPSEIDAIVEYLKTAPKPPKSTAARNAPPGPMD